jgi:hypothetical protein
MSNSVPQGVRERLIPLNSWNRFNTNHLAVVPSLLGRFHRFTFDAFSVRVELPSHELLPIKDIHSRRLSFNAWREIDGERIPRYFSVYNVDIRIFVTEPHLFPEEALDLPPNAFDLVPKERQEQLKNNQGQRNFSIESVSEI